MNAFSRHPRRSALLATSTLLLSVLPALTSAEKSANYLQHPLAKSFVDEVVAEGKFKRADVEALLASATRKDSILDAIARPAEKTKTWAEYKPIFVNDRSIDGGIAFYRAHQDALIRAEKEYGVSRYIILAIIGVETRYGGNKGNFRVIDALATLAFDYPPRAPFFRSELKHFLHLKEEAHIDLMTATGSYAGAMGFPQFISSSYRNFAVDFDHDDHTDLINNPVDAIGSVANYFRQHGWDQNKPVASLARFMGDDSMEAGLDAVVNQDLTPVLTVADLRRRGLEPDQDIDADAKATALRLEGAAGIEYWIGLNNFYVITRYNRSPLYALAVYQLSEALRARLEKA